MLLRLSAFLLGWDTDKHTFCSEIKSNTTLRTSMAEWYSMFTDNEMYNERRQTTMTKKLWQINLLFKIYILKENLLLNVQHCQDYKFVHLLAHC